MAELPSVAAQASDTINYYCLCQQADSGIMIECIRGTGGCHGWVHPACCGLILTKEELEALDSYICPLCEKPDDDYTKMKSYNTKRANEMALKLRKNTESKDNDTTRDLKKEKKKKKEKERTCQQCNAKFLSSKSASLCKDCIGIDEHNTNNVQDGLEKHSRKQKKEKRKKKHSEDYDGVSYDELEDRRRSHRETNRHKKSYHIPGSDDEEFLASASDSSASSKSTSELSDINDQEHQIKKRRNRSDGEEKDTKKKKKKKHKPVEEEEEPVYITAMVIEKIMGVRERPPTNEEGAEMKIVRPVIEYFIKWKNFSYLHCSWETKEVLLDIDPQANKQKIKRFHEKEHMSYRPSTKKHTTPTHTHGTHPQTAGPTPEDGEEEYFNPEYLEIQRIIAHRTDTPIVADPEQFPDAPVDDGERYLVKWRVLPYTDATWERKCDLTDDLAIEKYMKQIAVKPPKGTYEHRPRPSIRDYRKLDTSPVFGADKDLTLRAYQLEGLNWLMWNWFNERSSILADEMGLGKTIQTLAFLDQLRTHPLIQCRGPFLVVAPLSLISQWQNECDTWTTMNAVVYHGNSDARELIRMYEFYYPDGPKKDLFRFNILVTTYEVAIKDISILSKIRWRALVVDEAHRLKNQSSRLVEQLRSLKRDHCVLLTGTPLQNKTEELWALLNFLDSSAFPNVNTFLAKFGDLHEASQVADLHQMLKPYLLRRVKEDVEKALPPKEETIIEVELTAVQKQWYRAIYEKNTAFLHKGASSSNMPNLMNVMMELRKCCNHPYLNNGVEDVLTEGLQNDAERHEMMVKCCGKMVLLDKLLPRLKEGGHKVLIFSQMVRVLDLIEDYLRYIGHAYERLDGNIRGNDRQAAVNRFVKPEYQRFVMLLSTKAGGLGLNLTAADTVIIFDSDWNPQNDLQAQARAHRIGQTHAVKIYRLITRKTYEMIMFHKASLKLGLDKAVLTHMRHEHEQEKDVETLGKLKKGKTKAEEVKEIDELLKRGAYDVFREEDNQAAEQFCAADIDQILQRSSHLVTHAQEAKSSFSKASFVSATSSEDVDLDDPDFWKKAVGLSEAEIAEEQTDILPMQRKRTRVNRFGVNGLDSEDDEFGLNDANPDSTKKRRRNLDDLEELDRDTDDEKDRQAGEDSKRNEIRDWTLNGRDRLQRALMHFGFGRWEIIRSQSGGSRTLEEVERFAREFIFVSGLACDKEKNVINMSTSEKDSSIGQRNGEAAVAPSRGHSHKDEPPFIKAAVRASVFAVNHELVKIDEIAPVLIDEEFTTKLRQGGGKRVLVRLDMLLRLKKMIEKACDLLDSEFSETVVQSIKSSDSESNESSRMPPPPTADVDERVAFYGVQRVADVIEIADVGERPSWTQIMPWWNEEADRNLLMGVFAHGYGRCPQILEDERLCFSSLANAYESREETDRGTSVSSEPDRRADGKEIEHDASASESDSETTNKTTSRKSNGGSNGSLPTSGVKPKKFKHPEVQAMNRLLFWLLSADEILKKAIRDGAKKDRAALEQQRQITLERNMKHMALTRVERKAQQLTLMDIYRQWLFPSNTSIHNQNNTIGVYHPYGIHAKGVSTSMSWTKDERRVFSYTVALYGAPHILAKTCSSRSLSTPFQIETSSLSWMTLLQRTPLLSEKTTEALSDYFHTFFYPKCLEVAVMKVDPMATDQRAMALADLVGIDFIDPSEGVLAHGLKARILAWTIIRRSELLANVLKILSDNSHYQLLQNFLSSGHIDLLKIEPWRNDDQTTMPVWWCPWIHDIAVLEGMARYGVYGWKYLLQDRKLPLQTRSRAKLLMSALQTKGMSNANEKEVHQASRQLPSFTILERRAEWLCDEILLRPTRNLDEKGDEHHPCSYFPIDNVMEQHIRADIDGHETLNQRAQELRQSMKTQMFRYSSEADEQRQNFIVDPDAPDGLNNFLLESQLRRDMYLEQITNRNGQNGF